MEFMAFKLCMDYLFGNDINMERLYLTDTRPLQLHEEESKKSHSLL